MKELFPKAGVAATDLYFADYTDMKVGKGVVITSVPPQDIAAFKLCNEPAEPVFAVNIEDYKSFKKGIKNCEAMCMACREPHVGKYWALFIELKYCGENKIEDYGPDVINQMDAVRLKLMALGKLSKQSHIIHFNYCSPNNAEAEPFDGFKETQDSALNRVENDDVIFHARMELCVVDSSVLIERKLPV